MRHVSVALVLAVVGMVGHASATDEPPLTADQLFDPDALVEVDIRMEPEAWDELRHQTRSLVTSLMSEPVDSPFTYFPADITINGVEINGVGIRKKGFLGSLDDQRPSLKIHLSKFRQGWPIEGLDRLTLNNNKQDRTLGSQVMGYRFFIDAGIPAPRCNLARVTINGESLGIYANVESVREPFLEDRFGDSSGDLLEGTVADFFVDMTRRFEAKQPDVDFAPLEEIAELLDRETVDVAALAEHVDIDAFIRFWAAESLLGFWDGYVQNQNNFFVYRHPSDSKYRFIPWGVDCAFETRMPIEPYEIKYKSVHHRARLANRLYEDETIRERYRAVLEDMLATHWDEAALLTEVDRITELVDGHLHATQQDLPIAHEQLRTFIKGRRGVIESELAEWPLTLDPPNRPRFFVESGSVSVTFSTVWRDSLPLNPFAHGTVEDLSLTISGEPVELRWLGVSACPNPDPNAPDDDTPTLMVFGRRASDNSQIIFGCGLQPEWFAPGVSRSGVEGFLLEGETIGPDANPVFAGGVAEIEFDEAGLEVGDPIRGRLTMRILHFSGELFGESDPDAAVFEPGTLWAAAHAGDTEAIIELIGEGADITALEGAFGIQPLTVATIYGQADAVEVLLLQGAPVNGTSRDGGTALHAAAFLGRDRCAELLLQHGANVEARNFRGESPSESMRAPWQMVQIIAGFMKSEVNQQAVMAGRERIAEMFRRRPPCGD